MGKTMRWMMSLVCFGALIGSGSIALAKPGYVITTVNLRAAPGTTNAIVAKIPGGSRIEASNCTGGWCAVTWQDKKGFAIQTALDLSGRMPPPRQAYGPPPGYVDGPPAYYGYVRPPGVYYGPYYGPRRWRRW
jgi:hypothetical protein